MLDVVNELAIFIYGFLLQALVVILLTAVRQDRLCSYRLVSHRFCASCQDALVGSVG